MLLRNAKQLEGHTLHAVDGQIGRVKDFYFDDHHWRIRYCVVETGPWLASRKVLISPVVLGDYDAAQKQFTVNLTVQQVRDSPDIDTDKPVSRRREEELLRYYGWPGYWNGGIVPTGVIAPIPPEPPPRPAGELTDGNQPPRADPYLRSVNDTIGYDVRAIDGAIGHIEDFLIDDEDWRIRYAVVDTRNWWPGKKVIVEPDWIRRVSWSEASIRMELTRDMIRSSPPYEPTMPWSEEDAVRLRMHYGHGAAGASPPS